MTEEQFQDTNQYLTFMLDNEIFALDIASIREVLELPSITRIPRTPEYMCGVINLRGQAVPVVDMRLKMRMSAGKRTVDTCIIIVEVEFDGQDTVMGALVDSVREVAEMEPDSIEPAPKMGAVVDTRYIKGMGRQDERFVIVLDIGRIFSAEELAMVAAMGGADAPREAQAAEAAL